MSYSLSIVIPTYRRTDSVARLLNLLQAQTVISSLEIIIVDQNEKGFLENAIGNTRLKEIKHIFQAEPNVSLARNEGAKAASSDLVLFLDDDVLPEKRFCEEGIRRMTDNNTIDVLSPVILRDDETPAKVLPGRAASGLYRLSLKEKFLHATFFSISAASFYRREVFFKSGGFDTYLFKFAGTAEDQEFFIRLIKRNYNIILDTSLSILIDERVAGGCDLRTTSYWVTREKCMKAWSYRCRMHNENQYDLKFSDLAELSRSAFLNRSIFSVHPASTLKQIRILRKAIRESRQYIMEMKSLGLLKTT